MLTEKFYAVLHSYLQSKNDELSNSHPTVKLIKEDIVDDFKDILGDKYKIKGSAGMGKWANIPNICFFNTNITKLSSKGYYLVYLFKTDMSGFYLSFNFGATDFNKKFGKDRLLEAANKFRRILKEEFPEINDYNAMNLGPYSNEDYVNGNVFSIYYSKDNLPSDDKLIKDLNLFIRMYDYIYEKRGKRIFDKEEKTPKEIDYCRNLIYFGAPGTGKSHRLNQEKEKLDCEYERVTFHHDYSYANFVGTYKPSMLKDKEGNKTKEIIYDFVPGPFIRTLVNAFKNPNKNYLLIIEEINRANVAAVFGDIFQLLDREKEEGKELPVGASEFPIQTSEDLKDYLKEELKDKKNDLSEYDYGKIWIPENMYLWATMNSADQGVFPMDTAFKRRWDFEYIGVDENELTDKIYHIGADNEEINWNNLRKAINEELLSYNINEDKLLGSHFIPYTLDDDEFNKVFKNKVLMYLFEDAGRSKRSKLFSLEKDENILFSKICERFDDDGLDVFNNDLRKKYEKINKESD